MSAHPLHLLQFGGSDDARLVRNVGAYLAEGLERNQRCVVIATQPHIRAFIEHIERQGRGLLREDRLVTLDAVLVAQSLLRDGMPDAQAFERMVGAHIRSAFSDRGIRGIRAYGEIVGVYWSEGRPNAAARLEELWNEVMRELDFPLYCGYPIDVFDPNFCTERVDALMCAHAKVISGIDANGERALEAALDRVLGSNASRIRALMRAEYRPGWSVLPAVEASILWLRNNARRYADDILRCAQSEYARLAQAGASSGS